MHRPFSEEAEAHLRAFAGAVARGDYGLDEVAPFLRFLDLQPPAAVIQIERRLKSVLWAPSGRERRGGSPTTAMGPAVRELFGGSVDFGALLRVPGLEQAFLFHGSGFFREAALNKLDGGAPSAFAVAALIQRLNDWVPSVRQAARGAVKRVLPDTAAHHVATAGLFLLRQTEGWQRWETGAALFDEEMGRAEVLEALAVLLRDATSAGLSSTLRSVCRYEGIDIHLPMLAHEARLPQVRAIALRALVTGKVEWPTGHGWEWIDKSLGQMRWVRTFSGRQVEIAASVRSLIEAGTRDRAASVRKAAADGLVTHRHSLDTVEEIAARLAGDRSGPVRDRADFVLRDLGRQG